MDTYYDNNCRLVTIPKMPAQIITEDDYDAWFNAVECGDASIKTVKLREEEYR